MSDSNVVPLPVQPQAPPNKPQTYTVNDMIGRYVRLRDKKKELNAAHNKEIAKYDQAMNTLEAWLLEHMNQTNLSSLRGAAGTAYRTRRTSATVSDWNAFIAYVRENDAWDLLEHRVAKLAAEAVVEETKAPIPGVDMSSEVCVNVRRAGE